MRCLYIVLPNERLCDIAKKLNVSIEELAKANGITNVDVIKKGDVLEIPSNGEVRI